MTDFADGLMSMKQHFHLPEHLDSNSGRVHPKCSVNPVLSVDLFEDFESHAFDFQSLLRDFW